MGIDRSEVGLCCWRWPSSESRPMDDPGSSRDDSLSRASCGWSWVALLLLASFVLPPPWLCIVSVRPLWRASPMDERANEHGRPSSRMPLTDTDTLDSRAERQPASERDLTRRTAAARDKSKTTTEAAGGRRREQGRHTRTGRGRSNIYTPSLRAPLSFLPLPASCASFSFRLRCCRCALLRRLRVFTVRRHRRVRRVLASVL